MPCHTAIRTLDLTPDGRYDADTAAAYFAGRDSGMFENITKDDGKL